MIYQSQFLLKTFLNPFFFVFNVDISKHFPNGIRAELQGRRRVWSPLFAFKKALLWSKNSYIMESENPIHGVYVVALCTGSTGFSISSIHPLDYQ